MKKMTDRQIANFVLKYGKQYTPAVLPADIQRGEPGKCFDWCAATAAKSYRFQNGRYRYVEGIASIPGEPENFTNHAWLTDGIHAFDPTWMSTDKDDVEHPVPSYYIGVEMDILDVGEFMVTTEYQGIMYNSWRSPEIWARIKKKIEANHVQEK